MKKSALFVVLTTLGFSAMAAETLYWLNAERGRDWLTPGLWCTTNDEDGSRVSWTDGAIADYNGSVYIRNGETVRVEGLVSHANQYLWVEPGGELQIGAAGIRVADGDTCRLNAHDGAVVRLLDDQTWRFDSESLYPGFYLPFCGEGQAPAVTNMPVIAPAKPLTLKIARGQAQAAALIHWSFAGDMAGSTLVVENDILSLGLHAANADHKTYIQDTHKKAMVNAETIILDGAEIRTQASWLPGNGRYGLAKNLILRNGSTVRGYWGGRLDFANLTVESGAGMVTVNDSATLASRELTFDVKEGASLTIDGQFSGSPTYVLKGAGDVTLAMSGAAANEIRIFSVSDFTGHLTLANPGLYELPPTATWPEGMTVSATDPAKTTVRVFSRFYEQDWSRLPEGVTRDVKTEMVVYDAPIAAGDLNLVGTTVYVRGNGLTAATRIVRDVNQANDAVFVFQRPATVASPMLINRGKVVVKNQSEGLARFTGAISVLKIDDTAIDTSFQVNQGVAEVAGGLVVMGKNNLREGEYAENRQYGAGTFMVTGTGNMILSSELRLRNAGGGVWSNGDSVLSVTNGGHIVTEWTPEGCQIQACGGVMDTSTAAVIEILEGGRITLDNNSVLRVGENAYNKVGRLVIDGGELITIGNGGAAIRTDSDLTEEGTRSVVEFRRGTITLTRHFESHNNSGIVDFLWSGGTIRYPVGDGTALNNPTYFREVLFRSEGYAVQILGDVTLDFTDGDFPAGQEFKAAQYWNNTGWSTANPLPWRGNGRLHLVDRKARGMTFVVNAQHPDATAEKWPTFVSDSVNVKVVTAASTPLSAHGIGLGAGTVTVVDAAAQPVALNADELVIAGANCSAAQVAASVLTASEATVLAGGVWRNATWSALPLTKLSFETGSVLEFDGTRRTLTTLALPETMTYRVASTAKSGFENAALVATAVEKGETLVWTPDVGVRPREVALATVGGTSQVYLKGGLLVIFR